MPLVDKLRLYSTAILKRVLILLILIPQNAPTVYILFLWKQKKVHKQQNSLLHDNDNHLLDLLNYRTIIIHAAEL